ncbi:MAG: 1-(5-phosphoribosyl)-5-[(5-phosphoribosylamino)methylideneamino]imidazole-4-carboxamide isomerase [Spirochaetales bacterium]|nr:1-(5-phosphoribosyl)-5-[(5-phosphoribosylamino)methylideneamino]imidazole-4-carboxamide isomerase [Spirochaetales bacterium]
MTIIPAIDLLNGQCVRLYKGSYDQSKIYDSDAAGMAKSFEKAGARRIHLVDLDAARSGADKKSNRDVLRLVRNSVSAMLEVGGGIRTEKDVNELLDIGIDRLILGTVLAKDPDLVESWIKKYGQVFIAGIDALNGEVKVSGWEEGSALLDTDLAKKSADMGIISIIYTNIDKDGTLAGPDIESTVKIAGASGLPVTLSGGISGPGDVAKAVKYEESGIRGIITGKALYEGRLNLSEIIKSYQGPIEEGVW